MGLTNSGRDFIAKSIINEGATTFFDGVNAHIGVGDGVTAFAVTQTDLVGASKTRNIVDSAPARTVNEVEFVSTFGPLEAQHDWSEWGDFNASVGGEMLNRKVENLGTKTGGTWVLTVTLAVNVG
jgi:hypothetical protein